MQTIAKSCGRQQKHERQGLRQSSCAVRGNLSFPKPRCRRFKAGTSMYRGCFFPESVSGGCPLCSDLPSPFSSKQPQRIMLTRFSAPRSYTSHLFRRSVEGSEGNTRRQGKTDHHQTSCSSEFQKAWDRNLHHSEWESSKNALVSLDIRNFQRQLRALTENLVSPSESPEMPF